MSLEFGSSCQQRMPQLTQWGVSFSFLGSVQESGCEWGWRLQTPPASWKVEEVPERSHDFSWSLLPQSFSGPSMQLGEGRKGCRSWSFTWSIYGIEGCLEVLQHSFPSIVKTTRLGGDYILCWCFSLPIVANCIHFSLSGGVSQTLLWTLPKVFKGNYTHS